MAVQLFLYISVHVGVCMYVRKKAKRIVCVCERERDLLLKK